MSPLANPRTNLLLASASPRLQRACFPALKKVDLTVGMSLTPAGRPSDGYIYLPVDCIIAVVSMLRDGSTIGTAMIGREGMWGIDGYLGDDSNSATAVIQASGTALRLPCPVLKQQTCQELSNIMLHCEVALMRQMVQTSACGRRHSIEQQLCRWILQSLDRLTTNTLTITQQFIAQLLGVRREAVNAAIHWLQSEGAIKNTRGKIKVLNRDIIERLSCECYEQPVGTIPAGAGRASDTLQGHRGGNTRSYGYV